MAFAQCPPSGKKHAIKRKGKEELSRKRREKRKLTKKSRKTAVVGIEPCTTCKNGPYTASRYGLDLTYGVYIRSAKIHVRSYGYTDMVGNFHIRVRLYGVSRYAKYSYVRFWPTLIIHGSGHIRTIYYMYDSGQPFL